MIRGGRTMITRKSQEMARLTVEDCDGVIDAIAFLKIYGMKRNIISMNDSRPVRRVSASRMRMMQRY